MQSLPPLHITAVMSRSVSFVDRLELEFPGNHFCHALTLGDVDGDGVSAKYIHQLKLQSFLFTAK